MYNKYAVKFKLTMSYLTTRGKFPPTFGQLPIQLNPLNQ